MTRAQFVFVVSLLMVGGCNENRQMNDQCLRAKLFQQCMTSLPAGPTQSHYSDWDEIVGACESAAMWQSLRRQESVKPECRP